MKARRSMKPICPDMRSKSTVIGLAATALAAIALFPLGGTPASADTTTVSLSLTKYTEIGKIDAGSTVGVRPRVVHLHVGDHVVFVNDDTDHHTATALVHAVTFVDDPRWTDDALHESGDIGSGFWTTGDLAPGQKSAPLVAKKTGTYLFGCFFDYGAGMRGEIVVEP